MPQVALVHLGVSGVLIAGRTVRDHWQAVVTEAGLRPASERGPLVVVDARCAALRPARLRALAETLAGHGIGGAALAPDGRVVAVALHEGPTEPGPEVLEHPGGHTLEVPAEEAWSVDDPWSRVKAEREVVDRVLQRLVAVGVSVIDPGRIWVEPGVRVAPNALLWPGVTLLGRTRIGARTEVRPGCWLKDTEVGEGCVIKPNSVCEGAVIGPDCAVGPSAHLRPGARLERDVKVGNFVEVKNAHLHTGVRASHLSYLGDAEVGEGANVGAGTITCNYDGFAKHRTEIGARAFIGSNTSLVAPVSVGEGAIVGAGSTITRSVPAEALSVERAEERILEGKAPRINERNRRRAREATEDG